jgi:hypothetical protein
MTVAKCVISFVVGNLVVQVTTSSSVAVTSLSDVVSTGAAGGATAVEDETAASSFRDDRVRLNGSLLACKVTFPS